MILWFISGIFLLWMGGILEMIYGVMIIPRILIVGTYVIALSGWFVLNILPEWMLINDFKRQEMMKKMLDFSVTPAQSVVDEEEGK